MGKRLVKTAKQQFEERLREVGLLEVWKDQGACGRIGTYVWDNDSIVIFVHEDDDDKYSEFFYPPFEELREDETFCKECLKKFACHSDDRFVASLVRWIVDNGQRPLDPEDVYHPANHLLLEESHDFEDLYEEVPDVRIITAKEQWEKDSQGAEIIQTLANGSTYKVAVTDGSITFFVYQDGGEYFREVYPSFEELRKDVNFVMAYLWHVWCTHDQDVDAALAWLQGGKYTMSKVSLLDIYEVGKDIDHLCYHDKEEPTVVKQDFSNDVNELRKKMVVHIIELCEQGMTINESYFTEEFGGESIVFEDDTCIPFCELGSIFIGKNKRGEWALCPVCSEMAEYDLMDLSVETLLRIVASLQ